MSHISASVALASASSSSGSSVICSSRGISRVGFLGTKGFPGRGDTGDGDGRAAGDGGCCRSVVGPRGGRAWG